MNAMLQNAEYIERGIKSLEWFGFIAAEGCRHPEHDTIFSKIGQCSGEPCGLRDVLSILTRDEIAALKTVVDQYRTWTNARVYFGSMSKEELSTFLDALLQCECWKCQWNEESGMRSGEVASH